MVAEYFKSSNELYMHVLPALQIKKKELATNNFWFITEKDIWDCLNKLEWVRKDKLTLFDIVSSILNLKEEVVLEYMSSNLTRGDNNVKRNNYRKFNRENKK